MPEQTQTVTRRGKLFEFGEFADKAFSLTPEEWAAANADLDRVPLDLEHKPTILDGHLGYATGFEVRGNSIFGQVEIPEWLHNLTKDVPIKVSAAWDRAKKRLEKLALVLNPRIPDAAVFHAAFSSGVIAELPAEFAVDPPTPPEPAAEFATPPTRTDSVQDKLQFIHGIAALHPGICPNDAGFSAEFAHTNEHKALKTIHDTAVQHGASCKATFSSEDPMHKTHEGQRFHQNVHDMAASAGAVCNKPANFHSAPELEGIQKQHDTAVECGAQCRAMKDGGRPGYFSQDNPPMKLKVSDLRARLEGRPDDEEIDLAALPAPQSQFSTTPEGKALLEKIAAMEAEREVARKQHVTQAAALFAQSEYDARHFLPPAVPWLAAIFAQAAEDDHREAQVTFSVGAETKQMSRVDALKALCAAMPKHTLFSELTPADLPAGSHLLPDAGKGKDPLQEDFRAAVNGTMKKYQPTNN